MNNLGFKKIARVFSLMLVFTVILSCFGITASAAEESTGSITGYYAVENKPIDNVEFNIYQLATFEEGYNFKWTEEFEGYHVTAPKDWSSEELNNMVGTLSGYAARDNIIPTTTTTTGTNGRFTVSDLEKGMYLVVGKSYDTKVDATTYHYNPVPFLVFFPYYDEESKTSKYDVEIEVKHTVSSETDTVSRHVLKTWSDAGYTSNRPSSVEVDLLQDGRVLETVTLNSGNNWRYTWEELEGGHDYEVVETAVGGRYTTTSRLRGITYQITNTYNPPETPVVPETPVTVINNPPPVLSEYKYPEETVIEDEAPPLGEKIPQTGQLLWPIPFLAGAGSVTSLIGIFGIFRRKEEVVGAKET